jgi:hypothetical protein
MIKLYQIITKISFKYLWVRGREKRLGFCRTVQYIRGFLKKEKQKKIDFTFTKNFQVTKFTNVQNLKKKTVPFKIVNLTIYDQK